MACEAADLLDGTPVGSQLDLGAGDVDGPRGSIHESGEEEEGYVELLRKPGDGSTHEDDLNQREVAGVDSGGPGPSLKEGPSGVVPDGPSLEDLLTDDDNISSDEEKDEKKEARPNGEQDMDKVVRDLEKAVSEGDLDKSVAMLRTLVGWRAELRVQVLSADRLGNGSDLPFPITVTVETAAVPTGPSWALQVKQSMTIFALKMKVALLYGIPISQQTWIIGRNTPTDTETLRDHNVRAEDKIFLYINKQRREDLMAEKMAIERFHQEIVLQSDKKNMELSFTQDEYSKFLKEKKLQQREQAAAIRPQITGYHQPYDQRHGYQHQSSNTMSGYPGMGIHNNQPLDVQRTMSAPSHDQGPRQPNTFGGFGRTPPNLQPEMPNRSQVSSHVFQEYNGQREAPCYDAWEERRAPRNKDANNKQPYPNYTIPPMDPQHQPLNPQIERNVFPPPHLVQHNIPPRDRTGAFLIEGPVGNAAQLRRPMDFDRQPQMKPKRAVSMGEIPGGLRSFEEEPPPHDKRLSMAFVEDELHQAGNDIEALFGAEPRRRPVKDKKKRVPGSRGFGFSDDHFLKPRKKRGTDDLSVRRQREKQPPPAGLRGPYYELPDRDRPPTRKDRPPFYDDRPPFYDDRPSAYAYRDLPYPGRLGQKLKAKDVGWPCPACTFVNPPSYPGCKQCFQDRPDNYNPPPLGSYIMDKDEEKMVAEREASEVKFAQMQVKETEEERRRAIENRKKLLRATEVNLMFNDEAFECPICFSEVQPGEGIRLQECLHEICRECCVNHINISNEAQVKCPFTDGDNACQQTILDREIRQIVGNANYQAFVKRSLKTAEATSANTFHCLTPNCEGFCFYDDQHNFFNCPICRHMNCLTCNVIHEGMNCKEYQDDIKLRAVNDQNARETQLQLQQLIREGKAQHCPQCGVVIQKKGGCPNMTCSVCRRGFRWTGIDM